MCIYGDRLLDVEAVPKSYGVKSLLLGNRRGKGPPATPNTPACIQNRIVTETGVGGWG